MPGVSVCCAIARGRRSPWTGCANSIPSTCSTRAPNRAPAAVARVPTPLELLDRLAALVPPPRVHRHRYFGALAPNSPLRAAVTALAPGAGTAPPASNAQPTAEAASRRAARYSWALLLARIYEVFPLLCPMCGAEMRIIAFIVDRAIVRDILGSPRRTHRATPHRARSRPAAVGGHRL